MKQLSILLAGAGGLMSALIFLSILMWAGIDSVTALALVAYLISIVVSFSIICPSRYIGSRTLSFALCLSAILLAVFGYMVNEFGLFHLFTIGIVALALLLADLGRRASRGER
jgi:hypothetical protein